MVLLLVCEKHEKDLLSRGWLIYEKSILYHVLKNKFKNPRLANLLKKTARKQLINLAELNDCELNDCENLLGQIIMFIRSELNSN